VIELEKDTCDQPGCKEKAVARFKLKKHYINGHELAHVFGERFRKFCKKHLRRGDCGLSDSDANYEPMDGIGPDSGTVPTGSPSSVLMPDGTLLVPKEPEAKS
jgi:hypothetical protein